VVHHGRVQSGDWVVVHGCGGVGLSAVMIAAARGAHIIAVDISPAALELAQALGATTTLDPGHAHVVDAVRDLTGGGAQVSIDALGSIETCQNSICSLRKRGRHVQVGLMLGADDAPSVPMSTVIAAELEIVGSHGMAAHDYPTMLAEITAGTLSPQRLVQHRIDLSEAPANSPLSINSPTTASPPSAQRHWHHGPHRSPACLFVCPQPGTAWLHNPHRA
jgi:alcohol dehydrogenase